VLAAKSVARGPGGVEVTGSSWEIVRFLESHVAKVIVVSRVTLGSRTRERRPTGLTRGPLARLLWVGDLDEVWTPDEPHARVAPGGCRVS